MEELPMMERGRLCGNVAIITGGASGMGRGISREFASQGASVVIADINADGAVQVAEEIQNQHARAMVLEVDVRNHKMVTEAVEHIVEQFGKVDVLVNCAGVNQLLDPEETTIETWENIRSTILDGAWYFAKAVIPFMKKNRNGKIVNIGSGAAVQGIPQSVPYTASKHGLLGLTRALAVDLGPYQINVNCICPGAVETPLLKRLATDTYRHEELKRYPLGRLGKIEDVAKAALFLASSDSDWITGIALPVDGGLTSCIRVKNTM